MGNVELLGAVVAQARADYKKDLGELESNPDLAKFLYTVDREIDTTTTGIECNMHEYEHGDDI